MTHFDRVFEALSALPVHPPTDDVTERVITSATRRLLPRPGTMPWAVAIAASALCYLGWALQFVATMARE